MARQQLRPRRDPSAFRGPRPQPGQTVMHCPLDNRFTLWDFLPDDRLQCTRCLSIKTREETT